MIGLHDEQTIELSVMLGRLPQEIDDMPYLDSLRVIERWAKRRRGEMEFEAALHGRKMK